MRSYTCQSCVGFHYKRRRSTAGGSTCRFARSTDQGQTDGLSQPDIRMCRRCHHTAAKAAARAAGSQPGSGAHVGYDAAHGDAVAYDAPGGDGDGPRCHRQLQLQRPSGLRRPGGCPGPRSPHPGAVLRCLCTVLSPALHRGCLGPRQRRVRRQVGPVAPDADQQKRNCLYPRGHPASAAPATTATRAGHSNSPAAAPSALVLAHGGLAHIVAGGSGHGRGGARQGHGLRARLQSQR
jgi:hypothetical protein